MASAPRDTIDSIRCEAAPRWGFTRQPIGNRCRAAMPRAMSPRYDSNCHTRGSRGLLERVKLQLGLQETGDGGDKISLTTPDGRFTIRTVACFGQCALAPVVEVDHAVFGHMNEQTLHREIEHLSGRKA